MTDDLVDTDAHALGELAVVQRARCKRGTRQAGRVSAGVSEAGSITRTIRVPLDALSVDDRVQLVGRDTRLDGGRGDVEDLASKL